MPFKAKKNLRISFRTLIWANKDISRQMKNVIKTVVAQRMSCNRALYSYSE